MPDAPGLPDRKRFTPIRESTGGTWPLVMHRHKADRAGLHHDLRIGDRRAGVAHSWAYRSGRMPRIGERIEVHQQPDHTIPYMKFKGTIAEGYGKGSVGIARSGKVEVLDSGPEKLHFRLGRRRFVLVKTPRYGERSWLLIGLPAKKREKVAVHLVPAPDLAEEMLKAAESVKDQRATDRAVGQGIGSAATHLVTGYAAGPWLYPKPGMERPTVSSLKELGVKGSFKKYWGRHALVPAAGLAGIALAGGAMKERIQAGYEGWRERGRKKTADAARPFPGCAKCMSEPMEHCSKCRMHGSTDWKTGFCPTCHDEMERRHARNRFGKAAEVLEGFVHTAEDDVETLRLQLAAAGVEALGYGGDVGRESPYWSASLGDVRRLNEEKERLRKVVKEHVGEEESWDPAIRGILKAAGAIKSGETPQESGQIHAADATHGSKRASERSETAENRENGQKLGTGLLLYTGNPSERPSAPSPKPTKGFAQHFGGRFNPTVSRHRHAERTADEWMRGSAEYVDLGMRPNIVAAAREVLQIEPGKPFPRSQALKMLSQRKEVGSDAVTRRRAGVLKGMEEAQDSPEDVRELLNALEVATKHPRVRYIELTEKN